MALSGCLFAIALPATAGARPIDFQPTQQHVAAIAAASQYHPHGRPAAYANTGTNASSGQSAHYEGSVLVGTTTSAYSPPSGFHSDTQTNGQPTSTTQAPTVVVHDVQPQSGDDHTLAIVLASCALGIALCGAAFAVVRTGRLQRQLAGTNS